MFVAVLRVRHVIVSALDPVTVATGGGSGRRGAGRNPARAPNERSHVMTFRCLIRGKRPRVEKRPQPGADTSATRSETPCHC
jgi:hypothetical protein